MAEARRRRRRAPLPVLLAWAGSARAGGATAAVKQSDWTVGVLVGVLLCLALGLAAAWRHLCRLSAGRYHPRPMGRRALALLRGRWRRLRGRGEDGEEAGDEEEVTAATAVVVPREEEEEEEAMVWNQEEEEEEEEEEEAGESGPGEGQAAGGSAEALLSDLHAFSGTAAWGDAKPQLTSL